MMRPEQAATIEHALAERGIKLRRDWIEACLAELAQEAAGGNGQPSGSWEQRVYAMFLLCDLREASEGCLPPNVAGMVKQRIDGPLMLQVDEYKNVAAAAEQRDADSAGRVLKLCLSDGRRQAAAMEYRCVSGFVLEKMARGTKLLVSAVEVRRGMLLLTDANTAVLGGTTALLADGGCATAGGGGAAADGGSVGSTTSIAGVANSGGASGGNGGGANGGGANGDNSGYGPNGQPPRPDSSVGHAERRDRQGARSGIMPPPRKPQQQPGAADGGSGGRTGGSDDGGGSGGGARISPVSGASNPYARTSAGEGPIRNGATTVTPAGARPVLPVPVTPAMRPAASYGAGGAGAAANPYGSSSGLRVSYPPLAAATEGMPLAVMTASCGIGSGDGGGGSGGARDIEDFDLYLLEMEEADNVVAGSGAAGHGGGNKNTETIGYTTGGSLDGTVNTGVAGNGVGTGPLRRLHPVVPSPSFVTAKSAMKVEAAAAADKSPDVGAKRATPPQHAATSEGLPKRPKAATLLPLPPLPRRPTSAGGSSPASSGIRGGIHGGGAGGSSNGSLPTADCLATRSAVPSVAVALSRLAEHAGAMVLVVASVVEAQHMALRNKKFRVCRWQVLLCILPSVPVRVKLRDDDGTVIDAILGDAVMRPMFGMDAKEYKRLHKKDPARCAEVTVRVEGMLQTLAGLMHLQVPPGAAGGGVEWAGDAPSTQASEDSTDGPALPEVLLVAQRSGPAQRAGGGA
ncbi:unnamed protein product, partial [Phaeothamnion confervicola]